MVKERSQKMPNEIVWEIEYYEFSNGRRSFSSRLKKMGDQTTQTKIIKSINKMELGNLGDSEPVGNGISELRLDYGSGYRVYYARVDKATLLILGVGDKSTQSADIEYAKHYLSEYKKDRRG